MSKCKENVVNGRMRGHVYESTEANKCAKCSKVTKRGKRFRETAKKAA